MTARGTNVAPVPLSLSNVGIGRVRHFAAVVVSPGRGDRVGLGTDQAAVWAQLEGPKGEHRHTARSLAAAAGIAYQSVPRVLDALTRLGLIWHRASRGRHGGSLVRRVIRRTLFRTRRSLASRLEAAATNGTLALAGKVTQDRCRQKLEHRDEVYWDGRALNCRICSGEPTSRQETVERWERRQRADRIEDRVSEADRVILRGLGFIR